MEYDIIKVLIGDDTATNGIKIASKLREKGIYAYTRKKNSNALYETILKDEPDVVITDLTYSDSDALILMKEVRSASHIFPAFIVISDIDNKFIERQVMQSGASYFLVKPFDSDSLEHIVKAVSNKKAPEKCRDIEIIVTDVIRRLGVPAHIKGYHYLRYAILSSIKDFRMMDSITKQLYPLVAKEYNTTSSRVERAIRHAIEIAWDKGNIAELTGYFGCNCTSCKGRPTNSEFIALITDKLRLQLKSSQNV